MIPNDLLNPKTDMNTKYLTPLTLILITMLSCHSSKNQPKPAEGTFAYDREFILKHDSGALVLGNGATKIIVSPKYQAKVFTSTAAGDSGRSFGWIHYKAFDGPVDPHINAYGGENRLWLGPEGGKFSLFFAKDAKMEFNNWHTPAPFDTESWQLSFHSSVEASMFKDMELVNYAGTKLSIRVYRDINVLQQRFIDHLLGLSQDSSVNAVGYSTANKLVNTGQTTWDETTGMPCIWILDMFPPSDQTTIVVPYLADLANRTPATTDYFGEIPADRIKMNGRTLFYKADGKQRGKLGIHPERAKNIAGSYDAKNQVLTLVMFDTDNNARFLNQEWNTEKAPFSGDAVNAYNDGPLATGGQIGPFYELESVSPAAFLKPGGALEHHHSVFHFTGSLEGLNQISLKTLGVSLDEIKKAI